MPTPTTATTTPPPPAPAGRNWKRWLKISLLALLGIGLAWLLGLFLLDSAMIFTVVILLLVMLTMVKSRRLAQCSGPYVSLRSRNRQWWLWTAVGAVLALTICILLSIALGSGAVFWVGLLLIVFWLVAYRLKPGKRVHDALENNRYHSGLFRKIMLALLLVLLLWTVVKAAANNDANLGAGKAPSATQLEMNAEIRAALQMQGWAINANNLEIEDVLSPSGYAGTYTGTVRLDGNAKTIKVHIINYDGKWILGCLMNGVISPIGGPNQSDDDAVTPEEKDRYNNLSALIDQYGGSCPAAGE